MGQFVNDQLLLENPLLETVSEENRRNQNDSGEHINGYYPEMTDIDGLILSQDGIIPTTAINNNGHDSRNSSGGMQTKPSKKFSLLHTFIPSFFFVILAFTISAVLVLETETEFFAPIRNWPEMDSLRFQYYQPLKDFIQSKIGHIF
jgi:FERM domain-containing protein 3/5